MAQRRTILGTLAAVLAAGVAFAGVHLGGCRAHKGPAPETPAPSSGEHGGAPEARDPRQVALVDVPGDGTGAPSCASAGFDLRACLSALVERKTDAAPLTIQIAPGTYRMSGPGGVLVFQRANITIRGTRRPGTVATAPSDTHIELDPTFRQHQPTTVLATFAQIIDSENIAFENLDLDGASAGLRGFGVCALDGDAGHPVSGIKIHDIHARNFTDFFTLIGMSLAHKSLHGPASAPDPALARLYRFTGSADVPDDPHQSCSGSFRRVEFSDNVLLLKSVGFYLNPFLVWQTKQYSELSGTDLVSTAGGKETKVDWYQAMMDSVTKNTDIVVRGNQFLVDIDPSFPGYQSQLDGYFHSGIKVQDVSGLVIEKNRFDARDNPDVWGAGAALNIASFTLRPVIEGNEIIFPADHKFKNHGIILESGFIPHIYFGVGLLRFTNHRGARIPMLTEEASNAPASDANALGFGGAGVFGPALGVRITNNHFRNAWISVAACCGSTIERGPRTLMWTDMNPLCEDMDAHQKPGDPKNDELLIAKNLFHFDTKLKPQGVVSGLPTRTPPEHELKANTEFLARHPGAPFQVARQCRRALSYTLEGNTIEP